MMTKSIVELSVYETLERDAIFTDISIKENQYEIKIYSGKTLLLILHKQDYSLKSKRHKDLLDKIHNSGLPPSYD